MNTEEESRIKRLQKLIEYTIEEFSEDDWSLIAMTFPHGQIVIGHERLLGSLHFGDEDYSFCAGEVLRQLIEADSGNLEMLEDYCELNTSMDTDGLQAPSETGPIKVFISHKAEDRILASAMKTRLLNFGIEGFVAREDINVTSMWELEIEKNLRECGNSSISQRIRPTRAHGANKR